jgi:transcriptional regulator with XRE-family HTH domain
MANLQTKYKGDYYGKWPSFLRHVRSTKKITQVQASKAMGLGHGKLSAYESGRVMPSIPTLEMLLRYYGYRLVAEREDK